MLSTSRLRRVLVVLPIVAGCGSSGDAANVDTTSSGSSTSTEGPSSDDDSTTIAETTSSTASTADTSGSSTATTASSEESESSASSSESGGPPDCVAAEGCSCVLGLCAFDFMDPPLVCEDDVCIAASCGNDEIDAGELCDDGNGFPTDDCTTECVTPTCGDGFLFLQGERCDGVPGSPCGEACDAEPTQTTGLDVASSCALAAGVGGRVYFALGNPTNRLTAYDTDGSESWEVDIVGGELRSIGARASGDVIVGVTSDSGQLVSTLQRFDSDGTPLTEIDLAAEQTAEEIISIDVIGDDTWVLTHADFFEKSGNYLCRYDASWDVQWCTEILQGDDPSDEWPFDFALSSTGAAAISVGGTADATWLVDPDGAVDLVSHLPQPPDTDGFFGTGLAFSPDGDTLVVGWPFSFSPGGGVRWGVYDLDGTALRFGEDRVEDAPQPPRLAYTPSGDLVIGSVVHVFDSAPWIRVETEGGAYRYAQRGDTVLGLAGEACDMIVTDGEVVLAGTTTFPERWFLSRFPLD